MNNQILTAKEILDELLIGNQRFVSGTTIHSNDNSVKKLKEFAVTGQVPKAIVLCCSDSRAPVEIIFDQDIGDLFVIRIAGNIVAPSIIGSVEFAASTFGTKLVLVMGHTECGAIKATLSHINKTQSVSSEHIHDIVGRIKPHIYSLAKSKNFDAEANLTEAITQNIMASVSQLSSSSQIIEQLILHKKLEIHGALLHLNSGIVDHLDDL